ncbi:MAG: hypothetical protein ACI37J_06915, partial [Candidatus Bruticola sp.]
MNSKLTKSLILLLGLAIISGIALNAEKAYAENDKVNTQLIAQLPSPVRRVSNNKAFTEEC